MEITNQIYLGDCLDHLENVPDRIAKITFADPPFNLKKKYSAGFKDNVVETEYLEWCDKWIAHLVRITADDGSIFIHHIPYWLIKIAPLLEKYGANFRHWIAWDSPAGPMGKSLIPNHYGILYFSKSSSNTFYQVRGPHRRCRAKSCNRLMKDHGGKKDTLHPFGSLTSDCWNDIFRLNHNKDRFLSHPCQLPYTLLERILLMCSDKGDLVYDPFMGTGTTALAAKRLDRIFSGAELSPEYHVIATKRAEEENVVTSLGDRYVSFYRNKVITIRDEDWPHIRVYFTQLERNRDVEQVTVQITNEAIFFRGFPEIKNIALTPAGERLQCFESNPPALDGLSESGQSPKELSDVQQNTESEGNGVNA